MKSLRNVAFLAVLAAFFISPSGQAFSCPELPYSGCDTWCNPWGGGYIGWNSDCESVCPSSLSCPYFCEDALTACEWYCQAEPAGFACNDLASYAECGCNYNR